MSMALSLDSQAVKQFCVSHKIRSLALFGSQAKGTARPDSDIDLLVGFEPDGVQGLLAMAALEEELSALMDGRKVDLRTPRDLSRHFRDEVVRTAHVHYVS